MAKSLGLLPSASTSRPQPIGPAPVSSRPAGQVETADLGLDEADPLGQHVLQRDAYRISGAGTAGDPGQLGDHLVVVVPVDQGQLNRGVAAQPGRQAQGDVQPGVARPGDHDLTAAPGGRCAHGVLHGSRPGRRRRRPASRISPAPAEPGCWPGNAGPGQPGRPRTWNLRSIRTFMIVFGLPSPVSGVLTFITLRLGFHASATLPAAVSSSDRPSPNPPSRSPCAPTGPSATQGKDRPRTGRSEPLTAHRTHPRTAAPSRHLRLTVRRRRAARDAVSSWASLPPPRLARSAATATG